MPIRWNLTEIPALENLVSTGAAQPLHRENWPKWARSDPRFTGAWISPVLGPLATSTGNLSTDNVHSVIDMERSATKNAPLRYYQHFYIKLTDGRVFHAGPFKNLEYERHRDKRPSCFGSYLSTSTE